MILRNCLCTLGALLLSAAPLLCQEPGKAGAAPVALEGARAAVERAALDYIEGFYEGDSTKLARSVWPEVRKYGYYRPHPDSAYVGDDMAYEGFFRFARNVRAGRNLPPAGAPKEVAIFDVQTQTASARVTAYWGTDYLLLAREGGRWVITHVLWQEPEPGKHP
jgi:hypothetical protein